MSATVKPSKKRKDKYYLVELELKVLRDRDDSHPVLGVSICYFFASLLYAVGSHVVGQMRS